MGKSRGKGKTTRDFRRIFQLLQAENLYIGEKAHSDSQGLSRVL